MNATPENVRPWGRYDILETGETHQVKRITIQPGQRNSYQSHEHRTEHWIIVTGQCRATIDDQETIHNPGSVVEIRKGQKHRFRCESEQPCVLIEVQTGTYFGEDDIVRYQDDYDRS